MNSKIRIGHGLDNYTTNDTQDFMLSQRILNGEKQLFALLLKAHNKALYAAVQAIVNREEDVPAAMLSTYAVALKRLYCFYGQCSFKVWILCVAVRETNRLLNEAGQNRRSMAGETPQTPRLVFSLYKNARLSKKEISACLQIPLNDIRRDLTWWKKQGGADRPFSYHHDYLIEEFMNGLRTDPASVYATNSDTENPSSRMEDADTKVEVMQQLKQEHSENLTLCANIRRGFLKGVEMQRIKNYTDWYWNTHLLDHFSSEEKVIFPILGKRNPLVKKAMAEHKRLRRLFQSKDEIHKMLNRIEEELEAHIRFEEKVLFKEIEQCVGREGVEAIESLHRGHEEPAWNDQFWK